MLNRTNKNLNDVQSYSHLILVPTVVSVAMCLLCAIFIYADFSYNDHVEVIAGDSTNVLYAMSDNSIVSAKSKEGSSAVYYGSDLVPVSYPVNSSEEDITSRMEELGIDELYVLGYIDDFSKDYKFTFILADDQVWTLQEYRDGKTNEWNFDTTLDEDKVKANIDLFVSTMQ